MSYRPTSLLSACLLLVSWTSARANPPGSCPVDGYTETMSVVLNQTQFPVINFPVLDLPIQEGFQIADVIVELDFDAPGGITGVTLNRGGLQAVLLVQQALGAWTSTPGSTYFFGSEPGLTQVPPSGVVDPGCYAPEPNEVGDLTQFRGIPKDNSGVGWDVLAFSGAAPVFVRSWSLHVLCEPIATVAVGQSLQVESWGRQKSSYR